MRASRAPVPGRSGSRRGVGLQVVQPRRRSVRAAVRGHDQIVVTVPRVDEPVRALLARAAAGRAQQQRRNAEHLVPDPAVGRDVELLVDTKDLRRDAHVRELMRQPSRPLSVAGRSLGRVIAKVEPLTQARALRGPFDYRVPDRMEAGVGSVLARAVRPPARARRGRRHGRAQRRPGRRSSSSRSRRSRAACRPSSSGSACGPPRSTSRRRRAACRSCSRRAPAPARGSARARGARCAPS